MTYSYSPSTGGFYRLDIHGDNIPGDAVEITDEEYVALIDGQATGKRVVGDEAGRPMLFDPPVDAALARRSEIVGRLTQIDAESIRPARAVAAAMASGQTPPEFDASKLASLESEAQALRADLAGLGS